MAKKLSNFDRRIKQAKVMGAKAKISRTTEKRIRPPFARRSNTIFLSESIGDFLAVESFLKEKDRNEITTIYYATQKHQAIETLLRSVPTFPNLREHVSVWDDFSKFWCFITLEECIKKLNASKKPFPNALTSSVDFGIIRKFSEFKTGRVGYESSSFLKHKLTDVSKFDLCGDFWVVCPYSTDKRIKNRDFDQRDWNNCIKHLEKIECKGVVLNEGLDIVPESERLLNLSNQTSIMEAIEILKLAKGYVGIDSCLSVLAAKLFQDLIVKSHNPHCYENAGCYYAPHKSFEFLVKQI